MLRRMRLHTQLLASYLAVLLISFGAIVVAVLLLLGSRPAPVEQSYANFALLMRGLGVRDFLREAVLPLTLQNEPALQAFFSELDTFAETRGVRVMWLLQPPNEERGNSPPSQRDWTVIYDSTERFELGEQVMLESDPTFSSPELAPYLPLGSEQTYGHLRDPGGDVWVYGGIRTSFTIQRLRPRLPSGTLDNMMLIAQPPPTTSLQQALGEFGQSLLPLLVQGAIIGLLAALVMALVISRGIARPLQSLARAASDVAQGNYVEAVPTSGPQEVSAVAEAFNQMSAEVRAAQQAQRDFLANVSHDLKTPLASIQGYSQAIMDGVARDPANAAQIIHDEAERLNRMVVELTDLARMQAGRLSLKMTALDMGEIVAGIGQRMSMVARKKGVNLEVETGPLPHIAGDGDRLAQVLDNLLSNAIKFTPEGGMIWLKTGVRDGGVLISVRDSGIGIPSEDLPRVFERFYQVDKARGPQRGTGLGLAIVREIIQAHGGQIQVYSAGEHQGTTFTIWLPSPNLSTIISRR